MATRGVNRVILVGNLVDNPVITPSPKGICMATITLATTSIYKKKSTGEKIENVQFHRVLAFDKLAEVFGEILQKGTKVYIEGRLQNRKWTDQNTGLERFITEIIANDMTKLDERERIHQNDSAGNEAHEDDDAFNDGQENFF